MNKVIFFSLLICGNCLSAQPPAANDVTVPLHLMQPKYAVPYGKPDIQQVKSLLDRVYNYLDSVTPAQFVERRGGRVIADMGSIDSNTILKPGDYRLTSYEWGVTYSGMLRVGEVTGDTKYTNYTTSRLNFLAGAIPYFRTLYQKNPRSRNALRQPIDPRALDDAGAICAAFIKTLRATNNPILRPVIDNFINYILTKEFRLTDGTLARNRPLKNTLWLDDLYMSVPAIAQMGKLTGDRKYYDECCETGTPILKTHVQ